MSELVESPHPEMEPEAPGLQQRNHWVGVRLLVSSTVFLFLPFVFAYVYLASLNTSGLWRPGQIAPPLGWGIAILLAVVACAALVAWARSEAAGGRGANARLLALLALPVGLLAIVFQIVEYARLDFGPTDGGFASVFVGWSGLFAVTVLAALVWLEVVVATAYRGAADAGTTRSDLEVVSFFLTFLAGLGAFTFAFLYLL
jgi:heme/copper-type cytochrome/quinol oxidase subunit 3